MICASNVTNNETGNRQRRLLEGQRISVKLHLRDKQTKRRKRQDKKTDGHVFLSVCLLGGV